METCLAGADEWRGGSGPLVLERGPATSPLFGAFFEAVQQAGHPLTDDVNGYRQEGFAAFDRNVHRGRRLSAARAYLHPVMGRPNLTVETLAQVTGLVTEGSRVTGVDYHRAGRGARRANAREVILCGGAINSPQLLLLSGIGPKADLEQLGIPVVADLPGVGSATCRTTSRSTSSTPPSSRSRSAPGSSTATSRASAPSGCSCAAASGRPTTSRPAASSAATTTSTTPT